MNAKYDMRGSKAVETVIFEDEGATLVPLCDLEYDPDKTPSPITLSFETDAPPRFVKNLKNGEDVAYYYDGKTFTTHLSVDMFAMYKIGL